MEKEEVKKEQPVNVNQNTVNVNQNTVNVNQSVNVNVSVGGQAEKKKKRISKAEMLRALKFVGFSISAGVIQIASFEILYDAIHWIWWPSYLISIVLSVIWNFTFNRKFTFKSANNVPIAMMWTLLYYVAFVPISVFGGRALEDIGWNGTLVTFIMMLLNFVTEFLWQRFFVFRKSIDTQPVKKKEQVVKIEVETKSDNNKKDGE